MSSNDSNFADLIHSNDVNDIVNRIFKDCDGRHVVKSYSLSSPSSEVNGFLGVHYNLKIVVQVKKSNGTEEDKVISLHGKFMPSNEYQRFFIRSESIFTKEVDYYNKIAPWLEKHYTGEKWMPRCYFAKDEAVVMEDLKLRGYQIRESFYNSYVHIKAAIAAVARLHACSFIADASLVSCEESKGHPRISHSMPRVVQKEASSHPPAPLTLKEIYPREFREVSFKKTGMTYDHLLTSFDLICAIGERRLGLDPVGLRKVLERVHELVEPSDVYQNVVCHGDLWTKNVMFADADPLPKCVLIDFQLVKYTPQVLDILMLFYLHTSRSFREKYEGDLLGFYYETLEENAKKVDGSFKGTVTLPSFDEVQVALENLRLFGPIVAAFYLPINLLDQEDLKNSLKDSENFEKFVTCDKIEETLSYMEKNEHYRSRIEETIEEIGKFIDKASVQ